MKRIQIQTERCLNDRSVPLTTNKYEQTFTDYHLKSIVSLSGFRKQLFRSENAPLKKIIKKHKVKNLCDTFIKKLKRIVPLKEIPDEVTKLTEQSKNFKQKIIDKLSETEGFKPQSFIMAILTLINIIYVLGIVFLQSIFLAFGSQIHNPSQLLSLINYSIVLALIDIVINFTMSRFQRGKNLKTLIQISKYYLNHNFALDSIFIVNLVVFKQVCENISAPDNIPYLLIILSFSLTKMFTSFRQVERFQHIYLLHADKYRYFALAKILFTNLLIGHIISIILNLMPYINPNSNWQTSFGIEDKDWADKYIWGYYWGINIMLTVGFGDLHATNFDEAGILIFVESFSCIMFAYNISTIGNILVGIKQKQQQRSKSLKVFLRMSQENNISNNLTDEIMNFIDQSFHIKEEFLYSEYDSVIEKLPQSIKLQYQKEANKHLFLQLPIINMLNHKSFASLAEKIIRKVAHPEQIIHKKGEFYNFTILQKGQLALVCRNSSTKLNGKVIQTISSKNISRLVSSQFLRHTQYEYNLKSQGYSLIYYLQRNEFFQALRSNYQDYQIACELKDRDVDMKNQTYEEVCKICQNEHHTYFKCPKLHYIPLKQITVYRYFGKNNSQRGKRFHINRRKPKIEALTTFINTSAYEESLREPSKNSQDNSEQIYNSLFMKRFLFQDNYSLQIENRASETKIQPNKKDLELLTQIVEVRNLDEPPKFWDIESDEASNFSNYFVDFNPCSIQKRYSP